MNKNTIGPTGDYPNGKLNQDDEGGINIGMTIENGAVVVAFSKPVTWLGLGPGEADAVAVALRNFADRIRAGETG